MTLNLPSRSRTLATIAAAVGTGIYEARQASTARAQIETLRQQHAPLTEQIQQLTRERDEVARQLAIQREEIERCHKKFCLEFGRYPGLKRCETLGTILIIEYEVDDSCYFSRLRDSLYLFFLKNQVLLRPLGNVLYVMPPYCITSSELHMIYELIIQTFKECFYE